MTVRRLRWPVKLNALGTAFDTVEQQSSEEILSAAENVIKTVRGGRQTNPDFGAPDTLFSLGGAGAEDFLASIETWEPRATASVDVSEIEGMISRVRTEIST